MTIKELLGEMRETLLQAGVPEHQINVRKGQIRSMADAFDWLHDLKMSQEYVRFIAIRGLLPEATWARYALFQIEGLREQILMSQASKALRQRWRNKRPGVINRNKKVKHENQ